MRSAKRLCELGSRGKGGRLERYSNDPIMADFRTYGFRGVVSKPHTIKNLSETVHALVTEGRG